MELFLGILQGIGIFLVFPLIVAFSIAGVYILTDRRARRAERAKMATRIETVEPTKVSAKEKAEEFTHEPAKI